jgi:hypothetical protein
MAFLTKPSLWIAILASLFITLPANAAMVGTADMLLQSERERIVSLMAQDEVQHKLIELGVDQKSAIERVNQMTHEELVEINSHINELPAGGVSTTNLLLIIIILILLL